MKLIDKDVLVAEIEKCYNECLKRAKITDPDYWNAKADAYRNVLAILDDTLEVKEVNLEEEIKEVQRDYKTIEEYEGYPCTMYASDIEWIARHFFELRIFVSNKA